MEGAHRGVLAGGEREVDVLGERPLVSESEKLLSAPESWTRSGRRPPRGARRAGRSSYRSAATPGGRGRGARGGRCGRRVRRPRGCRGPPRRRCRRDRGGTRRSTSGHTRARPRPAVVAVPRVDARLPDRVDLRAVAGAEADVEPAGQRVLVVRRPDVPIVPSTRSASAGWARRRRCSGRCGRSARRPRDPRRRCGRGRTPGRGYRDPHALPDQGGSERASCARGNG